MVLYDQNYKFLGMSSETLSYLGYEDLDDFTSQNSDFANLLVNKEGYIYKFENFSWIDFILYSGSPNKSGLIKLKNGKELEVKISVKEVFLTTEADNNSKYYAIRILSDDFVQVASKLDSTIAENSPVKNNFNLNNLMSQESPQEEAPLEKVAQEAPAENSGFVLDFPSEETLESKSDFKLDLTEPQDKIDEEVEDVAVTENNFKLDLEESIFAVSETDSEEIKQEEDFTLEINQESDIASTTTPDISFLQTTVEETVEEEKVTLNFLKTEEDEIAQDIDGLTGGAPENKENIIAQIQLDIEEIDALDKKETTIAKSENRDNSFLAENMENEDKKSFTSTLQSLFQNKPLEEQEFLKKNDTPQTPIAQSDSAHHLQVEFIHDSLENIALLKEFHASGNANQAEHIIIKMLSSANVLKLNDIIATLDEMQVTYSDAEHDRISQLITQLDRELHALQSELESEAV